MATVLEKFCDTSLRPDTEEDCYDPCPGHCVLSPWSHWSQCSQVRKYFNNKVNKKYYPLSVKPSIIHIQFR